MAVSIMNIYSMVQATSILVVCSAHFLSVGACLLPAHWFSQNIYIHNPEVANNFFNRIFSRWSSVLTDSKLSTFFDNDAISSSLFTPISIPNNSLIGSGIFWNCSAFSRVFFNSLFKALDIPFSRFLGHPEITVSVFRLRFSCHTWNRCEKCIVIHKKLNDAIDRTNHFFYFLSDFLLNVVL